MRGCCMAVGGGGVWGISGGGLTFERSLRSVVALTLRQLPWRPSLISLIPHMQNGIRNLNRISFTFVTHTNFLLCRSAVFT